MVTAALTSVEEAWQHRAEAEPLIDHVLALWSSAGSTANHPAPAGDLAAALLELRVWTVAQLNRTYDHARAIALGTELMADADRLLGGERPTTLAARVGLAAGYRSMGRLDDAIPLYESALDGSVRDLAPTTRTPCRPGTTWRARTSPWAGSTTRSSSRVHIGRSGADARPRPPGHPPVAQQPGRRLPGRRAAGGGGRAV